MRSVLFALACIFYTSMPAAAQDLIGSYTAFIGPADHTNSQGVLLTDFGAILQQDRANYHRFGRRDGLDMSDPIFANPDYRARIPNIWMVLPGSAYVVDNVLAGQPQLLSIQIYGSYGEPAFIVVGEGAG